MARNVSSLLLGACSLVLVLTGGCDSTEIDPFENEGKYFTIYGYLDPFASEQTIRVVPIRRSLETIPTPDAPQASINAEVHTEDLMTGEVIPWTHRLYQWDDTTRFHLFDAAFNPLPGHSYRLQVQQANGQASTVTVTIPERLPALPFTLIDVNPDSLLVELVVPGIDQIWTVRAHYELVNPTVDRPGGLRLPDYTFEHGLRGESTADGWRFRFNLIPDYRAIVDGFATGDPENPLPPDFPLPPRLKTFGVSFAFPQNGWPRLHGTPDLTTLSQPGQFSNVENGDGFVGALSFHRDDWPVDEVLQNRLFDSL